MKELSVHKQLEAVYLRQFGSDIPKSPRVNLVTHAAVTHTNWPITLQSLENVVPPLLFFVLSQGVTEDQTVHSFDYRALKVNALGYVSRVHECTEDDTDSIGAAMSVP